MSQFAWKMQNIICDIGRWKQIYSWICACLTEYQLFNLLWPLPKKESQDTQSLIVFYEDIPRSLRGRPLDTAFFPTMASS
jgi:hypothetical protein